MTAREIIKLFGGTREVAALVGRPRNVVSQWLRIGIPARHWPELSRHAARIHGAENVTLDVLESHVADRHSAGEAA